MECEKRVVDPINKQLEEEQRKLDPYKAYREEKLDEELKKLNVSEEEREKRKAILLEYELHLK
ncbi:hypothetical protein [Fictibacillus norfolkensis]|uniref:Uncharacterized protein n=1 Tax=Fictibacillus norfolkensis TaxID=2762233 RepID=A0ABR8SRX5_9BACL|nr:hypothetical protein [Fictibacillus norfolkensis]MBD7966257.1 hypothetical protein [Fictibacillus norfolkensis]